MADRHDDMAKVAGEAAGLSPEKWPGLAHILRMTASDEREACLRIVEKMSGADVVYPEGIRMIAEAIRARAEG